MYAYVARQAILDDNEQLHAYELLFRDGMKNSFPTDVCPDQATSKILAENHLISGLDDVTGGKPAFINFFEDTLLNHFPTSLDPNNVVIEILEDVPISSALLSACRKFKKMGYSLALDDHDFDPKWDIFLPYIDMIKVDVRMFNLLQISRYVRRIDGSGVKLLAEKVETREEYEKLKLLGFQYFQGYFFAKPEIVQKKRLASNQLNLLELINESNQVEMNLEKVATVIERDVGLSYKLLRFINSPAYGAREKIGSLKHAVSYMGEGELKKFISLLALANLNEDKPDELLALSIIRARFCEQVANVKGERENPPMAFLTGMFSLVDAILDEPMETLISKLPLLDEIKVALNTGKGRLANYLSLVKYLELAEWESLEALAKEVDIPLDQLHEYYMDAINWANDLTKQAKAGR